jgi:hypothetical protein
MSAEHSKSLVAHLFRYSIASADMYYTEFGMRDVFMNSDDQGNFCIWGEIAGGDTPTTIELCEVFLEYAMCCCAWCSLQEALSYMQDFGQRMGQAVGTFLHENTCLFQSGDPTDRALEYLFQTINARMLIQHSGDMEHFVVIDSPLEKAAASSGLRNIELAHHGMNIMCQSMIQTIDPAVTVETSLETPEFAFSILKPVFA